MSSSSRTIAAVALAALTGVATLTLAIVVMGTASASTLNGVATIGLPSDGSYLASGGSNIDFTMTLPSDAACSGDTANDGYQVWSYLVKQNESIPATTFSAATGPSQGFGLYESSDLGYFGQVNTAPNTGQIIGIPSDFQWGAGVAGGIFDAAQLLYTGGTSGVWEAGLACANSLGVLTDNWNTEVTFSQSSSDPNGFTWSAVPGPSGSTIAAVTSASSAAFTEGTAGSFTPTATGNPAPAIAETGTLPTGVTFAEGSLAGTPTVSGIFPIAFTATNGIGDPSTQAFTLTVDAPPAITSAGSTTFVAGASNAFTVTATGTPMPTLSETGGLPAGVTFNAATGVLSGRPSASGHFAISFNATNGIGSTANQSFTLTVSLPPLVLTTSSLPVGTVGVSYSRTLTATGGQGPYTWSVSSGALPGGLTLAPSSGAVSGTPITPGTSDFTAKVTDADGNIATSALSIGVASSVVAPTTLTLPVVGMASVPNGGGYWLADASGDVASCGSALPHGSLAGLPLNAPITRIVATTDGGGYWLVGADGGIFSFGDAGFYGSTGGMRLNARIVGLAPTPDGHGYWLVGADGGVFAFGDAVFRGSMGGVHLNKPVVGIATDTASGGYWLIAADGGIFAFHAPFYGTTAGGPLNSPINGMAGTADGGGYWMVASDGGIFNYGDAAFRGSMGGTALNAPVVGIAADGPAEGYWLVAADGGIFAFHAPFYGAG